MTWQEVEQALFSHAGLFAFIVCFVALLTTVNAVHARMTAGRPRMCPACTGTGRAKADTGVKVDAVHSKETVEIVMLAFQGVCLACRGKGVVTP